MKKESRAASDVEQQPAPESMEGEQKVEMEPVSVEQAADETIEKADQKAGEVPVADLPEGDDKERIQAGVDQAKERLTDQVDEVRAEAEGTSPESTEKELKKVQVAELRQKYAEKKAQIDKKFRGFFGGLRAAKSEEMQTAMAELNNLQAELDTASAELIQDDVNKYLAEIEARVDTQAAEMMKNRPAISKIYDAWKDNPAVQAFKKVRSKVGLAVGVAGVGTLLVGGAPLAATLGLGYVGWRATARFFGAAGFATAFYERFKASDEARVREESITLTGARKEEMKNLKKPGRFKIIGRKQAMDEYLAGLESLQMQEVESGSVEMGDLEKAMQARAAYLQVEGQSASGDSVFQMYKRAMQKKYQEALLGKSPDAQAEFDQKVHEEKGAMIAEKLEGVADYIKASISGELDKKQLQAKLEALPEVVQAKLLAATKNGQLDLEQLVDPAILGTINEAKQDKSKLKDVLDDFSSISLENKVFVGDLVTALNQDEGFNAEAKARVTSMMKEALAEQEREDAQIEQQREAVLGFLKGADSEASARLKAWESEVDNKRQELRKQRVIQVLKAAAYGTALIMVMPEALKWGSQEVMEIFGGVELDSAAAAEAAGEQPDSGLGVVAEGAAAGVVAAEAVGEASQEAEVTRELIGEVHRGDGVTQVAQRMANAGQFGKLNSRQAINETLRFLRDKELIEGKVSTGMTHNFMIDPNDKLHFEMEEDGKTIKNIIVERDGQMINLGDGETKDSWTYTKPPEPEQVSRLDLGRINIPRSIVAFANAEIIPAEERINRITQFVASGRSGGRVSVAIGSESLIVQNGRLFLSGEEVTPQNINEINNRMVAALQASGEDVNGAEIVDDVARNVALNVENGTLTVGGQNFTLHEGALRIDNPNLYNSNQLVSYGTFRPGWENEIGGGDANDPDHIRRVGDVQKMGSMWHDLERAKTEILSSDLDPQQRDVLMGGINRSQDELERQIGFRCRTYSPTDEHYYSPGPFMGREISTYRTSADAYYHDMDEVMEETTGSDNVDNFYSTENTRVDAPESTLRVGNLMFNRDGGYFKIGTEADAMGVGLTPKGEVDLTFATSYNGNQLVLSENVFRSGWEDSVSEENRAAVVAAASKWHNLNNILEQLNSNREVPYELREAYSAAIRRTQERLVEEIADKSSGDGPFRNFSV